MSNLNAFDCFEKMRLLLSSIFLMLVFVSTVQGSRNRNINPDELEELYSSGKYDEVAKLLKIRVDLVTPGKKKELNDEYWMDKDFDQADILLTPAQRRKRDRSPYNCAGVGRRWKTREVPYTILESSYNYSETNIKKIQDAIDRFNCEVDTVKFRPWRCGDRDCLVILNGNRCYGSLGRIGGYQTLTAIPDVCITPHYINHVMLHIIGLIHELNRPDRENYVHVLYNNIPIVRRPHYYTADSSYPYLGPYDIYSLTHFPKDLFGVNNTYKVLIPNVDMSKVGLFIAPGPAYLTEEDKKKIKIFYEMEYFY